MPIDKFLIAPLVKGLQTNLKPWLIADDAYEEMINCYTWRGSVRKRSGSRYINTLQPPPFDQLFSRLRVLVSAGNAGGNHSGTVPGIAGIGQMFSCGSELFTVNATGNPSVMLSTGSATVHTFDTTTGAFVITGSTPNADLFFYPAEPVMHLATYNTSDVSRERYFAFDTEFCYEFTFATGWRRLSTETSVGAAEWQGTNSDFFWTTNFRGLGSQDFVLFITNNVEIDAMRYFQGTATSFNGSFSPFGSAAADSSNTVYNLDTNDHIITCKIMIPYDGRLLLLNVLETINGTSGPPTPGTPTRFQNRVRFSRIGSPFNTPPGDVDAWNQNTVAGFIDAPIKEAITSVGFTKDRLIVFFEESVLELVRTGNAAQPFIFQEIDSDLGVESMNSVVHFNKVLLGFGSNGLYGTNGINVQRIDDLIPDTIFDINNSNEGVERVAGIRDYFTEQVYWSYPSAGAQTNNNRIFPNQVLVYDYINNNWSINNDSITAFGNMQIIENLTWGSATFPWSQANFPWNNPASRALFRSVIAGNQEGYTFVIDQGSPRNAPALQITNIAVAGPLVTLTSIGHNLPDNSYIYLSNIQDDGLGNMAASLNGNIYQISTPTVNTFTINTATLAVTGAYTGGGVVTRISIIRLATKEYNFYNKAGTNMAINQVDFLVDNKPNSEIEVQFYNSTSGIDFSEEAQLSGAIIGTNILQCTPYVLIPLEQSQERFWHSIYFNLSGETVQLLFTFNDDQILDPNIMFSDFQLNAMLFYATPTNQFGG